MGTMGIIQDALSSSAYTDEEKIKEVEATMKIEGLELTEDDIAMLRNIRQGNMRYDEARTKILSET